MRLFVRVFFCFAILTCAANQSSAEEQIEDMSPQLPQKENFHLFLLAGQSNMAGRGTIDQENNTPHARVLMLCKDGKWRPAIHPIHYDKPGPGAGLGKSFAVYLADQNSEITIGLIPAACGGSNIGVWEPGQHFNQTDSYPYDDAISRTHRATADGTLKGILWHQGESDSRTERADAYEANLKQLIQRFRSDLKSKNLPFIIGQLGRFEGKPWSESRKMVNAAHVQVAANDPWAAFVSSEGLIETQDQLHFETEALDRFGRRYAKAYLQLFEENNPDKTAQE